MIGEDDRVFAIVVEHATAGRKHVFDPVALAAVGDHTESDGIIVGIRDYGAGEQFQLHHTRYSRISGGAGRHEGGGFVSEELEPGSVGIV